MNRIWAIVLAAGESRRMQVPKLILPFRGKTIIEKVIENINGSEVFRTLVVLGSFRDEIGKAISHLPVNICFNDDYREGMLSSVITGLRHIPADADAFLVFPGDQPLIEAGVINELIKAYREHRKGIVIPVYRKRKGHPLLVDIKYRDAIYKLDKNKGLRSLTDGYPGEVLEVITDSEGILKDIDTQDDYRNIINKQT